MRSRPVQLTTSGHVATLAISSGLDGNRLDRATVAALADSLQTIAQDDNVRVAILTGTADTFCTGTEIGTLSAETLYSLRIASHIAGFDKPMIAAIEGDATDQGLEIALACDIRIAADDARFGMTQISRGLMPWDGGTQRLPRLIGRGRATELLLTGRLIDASEALEAGLVSEMTPRDQVAVRAHQIASIIASHGPIAARYLKEAVASGLDTSLPQALRLEADLNFILQTTSDRAEGIDSFLERRPPHYTGE